MSENSSDVEYSSDEENEPTFQCSVASPVITNHGENANVTVGTVIHKYNIQTLIISGNPNAASLPPTQDTLLGYVQQALQGGAVTDDKGLLPSNESSLSIQDKSETDQSSQASLPVELTLIEYGEVSRVREPIVTPSDLGVQPVVTLPEDEENYDESGCREEEPAGESYYAIEEEKKDDKKPCELEEPSKNEGHEVYEPSGNKEEEAPESVVGGVAVKDPISVEDSSPATPAPTTPVPTTPAPTTPPPTTPTPVPVSSESTLTRNSTIVVSDLMDLIISETIVQLDNSIEVDDIDEDFDWKIIGRSKIKGLVRGTHGRVSDLKTIKRTGDVVFITSSDNLKLMGSLGLGKLELHYDNFEFKLGSKNVTSGSATVTCKDNSISIVLTLIHKIDTDEYSLELDSVKIDLQGLKALILDREGKEDQLGKLLNWALVHFDKPIVGALNKNLDKAIRKALSKVKINEDLAELIPKDS